MGPPGAGKGSQAELLAEKFDLYHWEASKIVGRMIEKAPKGAYLTVEGKRYYFAEQKKIRREGGVWEGPFVVHCLNKKLKELAKEGKGVVVSGSPRTVYEAEKFIPLWKKLYGAKNLKVILLEISPQESIWRNTHRRECELVRHSILYSKETAKLTRCPLDGSKLVKRKDDTPEIIKRRLKEYKKKTLPIIEIFKKEGIKVKKIDGSGSIEAVFKRVLKALK